MTFAEYNWHICCDFCSAVETSEQDEEEITRSDRQRGQQKYYSHSAVV